MRTPRARRRSPRQGPGEPAGPPKVGDWPRSWGGRAGQGYRLWPYHLLLQGCTAPSGAAIQQGPIADSYVRQGPAASWHAARSTGPRRRAAGPAGRPPRFMTDHVALGIFGAKPSFPTGWRSGGDSGTLASPALVERWAGPERTDSGGSA